MIVKEKSQTSSSQHAVEGEVQHCRDGVKNPFNSEMVGSGASHWHKHQSSPSVIDFDHKTFNFFPSSPPSFFPSSFFAASHALSPPHNVRTYVLFCALAAPVIELYFIFMYIKMLRRSR